VNKIQVLAIGSPFGLDRSAWITANALRYNACLKDIEIVILDRPGVNLLDYFNQKITLIMDAVMMNDEFGKIIEYKLNQQTIKFLQHLQTPKYSTHAMGLAYSLELALALDQLPKHCYFFGFNINNPPRSKDQPIILNKFRAFRKYLQQTIIDFRCKRFV
jgi:Ni,Fe-hydrogenase maturation factor